MKRYPPRHPKRYSSEEDAARWASIQGRKTGDRYSAQYCQRCEAWHARQIDRVDE